ncbi:hypothetical protein ACJQWK_07174 [Exserohilum turcicum]|uniref:Uncharacterized protein n=1 Tax=Exserohilum turcicum (strain 28A) TaxID=671987 RepID=R0K515_EXST2|nr:uncharacterized protein SETTUDRAFT_163495 [Exserohilum turcica Et28A]EOA84599.1 hypothetical protein SETTUDRAFT_163495 [Exserohilum turcica Et28A]
MRQSTAILSILASSVSASDVVSFYFPGGYEGLDPVATINTVNPTMTEFRMACPTNVDSADCGWGPGLDATILSQTRYQATMDFESVYMSLGCDYNKKKVEMMCTVSQKGGNDDTGGKAVTASFTGDDVKFLTVTVVAGNTLLSTKASTTPTASATAESVPKSSSIVTSTSSAKSSLATPSRTASATSSSGSSNSSSSSMVFSSSVESTPTPSGSSAAPPESTGAAARYSVGGSALLMLAGAVALNIW